MFLITVSDAFENSRNIVTLYSHLPSAVTTSPTKCKIASVVLCLS